MAAAYACAVPASPYEGVRGIETVAPRPADVSFCSTALVVRDMDRDRYRLNHR